jgi:hypothetical protein
VSSFETGERERASEDGCLRSEWVGVKLGFGVCHEDRGKRFNGLMFGSVLR